MAAEVVPGVDNREMAGREASRLRQPCAPVPPTCAPLSCAAAGCCCSDQAQTPALDRASAVPAGRRRRADPPDAATGLFAGLRAYLSDAQVWPSARCAPACAQRAASACRPLTTCKGARCGRVVGGNAIGNGYWYSMGADGDEGEVPWAASCSAADAAAIQAEMQALVSTIPAPGWWWRPQPQLPDVLSAAGRYRAYTHCTCSAS